MLHNASKRGIKKSPICLKGVYSYRKQWNTLRCVFFLFFFWCIKHELYALKNASKYTLGWVHTACFPYVKIHAAEIWGTPSLHSSCGFLRNFFCYICSIYDLHYNSHKSCHPAFPGSWMAAGFCSAMGGLWFGLTVVIMLYLASSQALNITTHVLRAGGTFVAKVGNVVTAISHLFQALCPQAE